MQINTIQTQQGAALVVSLVILVILTLLGITAMSTSRTQDILVRNIQEFMLNNECSETELKQIQDDLLKGTFTVNGGQDPELAFNAPAQNIDITPTNCATQVSGTFQYAGQIADEVGCKTFTFEVSLNITSITGQRSQKTLALSRDQAGC